MKTSYDLISEARNRLELDLEAANKRFEEHTKAVSAFLSEMYAILVDPLDDEQRNVADTCVLLLQAARDHREQIYRQGVLPADWSKDSSLETWFPLTAEELTQAKSQLSQAQQEVEFWKTAKHDADAYNAILRRALENSVEEVVAQANVCMSHVGIMPRQQDWVRHEMRVYGEALVARALAREQEEQHGKS